MINQNRKIEDLRKSLSGRIYIYLKDTETCNRFLRNAESEGYKFGTIKPTENSTDDIIALEHRKQLSYIGFVGRVAWQCNGGTDGVLHRIDYDKYINGYDNFYFKSNSIVEKIDFKTRFNGEITIIGTDYKESANYINENLFLCKNKDEEIDLFDKAEEKFNALVLLDE